MKYYFILSLIFLASCAHKKDNCKDWIPLFNGENLDGWTIKFTSQPLGVNYKNTFRVEDGLLKVSYDAWDDFNGEFGHLFYKTKFSHYKLRVDYRFVGQQLKGGPVWAYKNSGIMLHSQSPESMQIDQDFPVSIECQLLGGDANGKKRPTMNLCTPGTHVFIKNNLFETHCINSLSQTYRGDVWVSAEVHVYGDSLIQHFVDGEKVMEYTKPIIGGSREQIPEGFPIAEGTPLKEGYISFQAETHPIEFRRIELMVLDK